jgi:hypothetical protein
MKPNRVPPYIEITTPHCQPTIQSYRHHRAYLHPTNGSNHSRGGPRKEKESQTHALAFSSNFPRYRSSTFSAWPCVVTNRTSCTRAHRRCDDQSAFAFAFALAPELELAPALDIHRRSEVLRRVLGAGISKRGQVGVFRLMNTDITGSG